MQRECSTCAAWDDVGEATGFCRRHSPKRGTKRHGLRDGEWPNVTRTDWCLEHVAKTTSQHLVQRPEAK